MAARERWLMLRTLLTTKNEAQLAQLLAKPGAASKRAQPRFHLFDRVEIALDGTAKIVEYRAVSGSNESLFVLREVTPMVSLQDAFGPFSGFLNTGNICVWPAEEILAWYLCQHREIVLGKTVLELGGGMTAMAGVAAVASGGAASAILTDGNPDCVANLRDIAQRNAREGAALTAHQLLWSRDAVWTGPRVDVVLVADCLYVKDLHEALLHMLDVILRPDDAAPATTDTSPICLVMAPRRGGSLDEFVTYARKMNWHVFVHEQYDDLVWQQHLAALGAAGPDDALCYVPDSHYPLLLELRRSLS